VHKVFVIPGNDLEISDAVLTTFELVIGVFNWTVTALSPWIKEDQSKFNLFFI
jgi:hypothetical protein